MENLEKILSHSYLFIGFSIDEIKEVIKSIQYTIIKYNKNEIIAHEGEPISTLGLLLEGDVEVQKTYSSGKLVTVRKIYDGDTFGDVSVFSDRTVYPSTIVSSSKSKIMFISKQNIINLCMKNEIFLRNYLRSISNKTLYLSDKLKNISYETIRKKVVNYILNEYRTQQSSTITLSISRKEMAELFGVTRPALSNEFINMKKDGLIEYSKNTITINEVNKLENLLK